MNKMLIGLLGILMVPCIAFADGVQEEIAKRLMVAGTSDDAANAAAEATADVVSTALNAREAADSVLVYYDLSFYVASSPEDAIRHAEHSGGLDPRLIFVDSVGDSEVKSVAIWIFGTTVIVSATEGKSVIVLPICSKAAIVKLADHLANPLVISNETEVRMASIPTCANICLAEALKHANAAQRRGELVNRAAAEGRSISYLMSEFDKSVAAKDVCDAMAKGLGGFSTFVIGRVDADGEISHRISIMGGGLGNLGETVGDIPPDDAKRLSTAIRSHIQVSGGIRDASELLVSAHVDALKAGVSAKELGQQGKYDEALDVLSAADAALGKTLESIPGALMLRLSRGTLRLQSILLTKEKTDSDR